MKKSALRGAFNRILALMARVLPGSTTLRPFLHRLRGVKIIGRVFIGDDVYIENEYPECVELHEGSQICLRSTLIAHTRGAGRIIIGKNAFLGANCVVTAQPGKTISVGENSVVVACSLVATDVPPGMMVGNAKAKLLATVTVPLTMETSFESFINGLRPLKRR